MLTNSDLAKIAELFKFNNELLKDVFVTKEEFSDFKVEVMELKDIFVKTNNILDKNLILLGSYIERHSLKIEALDDRVSVLERLERNWKN